LPAAYYLINGISSEQKCNLTIQCLTAIHETGLLIVSLTCDGLASNLSMLNSLGCNFDIYSNFQSWFKHPTSDTDVYAFLDPSHALKSVRNTLGRMKILLDEDGNKIQWLHLEELHKLQEIEGLHLANKLRVKHIDYSKNKMKVKLASPLLNTSVANALQLCKDKLMLPQFQDCSASIRFTVIFDNLFDIFNSRNQRQHGFKKPISCNNYFEIIQKVDECSQYIKSLFIDKPRQSILNSKFKTGFLGWLINIQSMQQMYKFLCIDNEYLKYIPMYKISQDHLELIFGNIRSCGGYNNNPTVQQFKSAFKKLIIHTEIKEGNTGNCIPLEEISILNISSNLKQSKNPVNIINETANENSQKWFSNLDDTAYIDHDYCLEIPLSFTEYKNKVITYLAGYIAKKLMKTLHCVECVGAL